MICTPNRIAVIDAVDKARCLLRMAGLPPLDSLVSLLIHSAPRSVSESEAGPNLNTSLCACVLCEIEHSTLAEHGWAEFLILAEFFLDEMPRWKPQRRWLVEQRPSPPRLSFRPMGA